MGIKDANSAKLKAVNAEMPAPMSKDKSSAGPARPAAIPVTTKIPAPIIAPIPIFNASNKPNVFFSSTSIKTPPRLPFLSVLPKGYLP